MSPTRDDLARADMVPVPVDLLAILTTIIDLGAMDLGSLQGMLCNTGLATVTEYDPERHGYHDFLCPGAPFIEYSEPLSAALALGRDRTALFLARSLS